MPSGIKFAHLLASLFSPAIKADVSMNSPTRTEDYSLSIVVPLFNEEENLPHLVNAIWQVLANDPAFLELVLVDDGSADRTAEIARSLAAYEPRIKLVQHDRNRGLGAAIRTGLKAAQGDLILYSDADLPFDFDIVPELLALAEQHDVVIGCRHNRGEGGRRWLLSKGYNWLSWIVLGQKIRDVNFACKLLPRRAVASMNLQAEGSFIDLEILLECRRLGYTITEFPITYYPRVRGQSTLSRPQVIGTIAVELVRYFRCPPASAMVEHLEEADT